MLVHVALAIVPTRPAATSPNATVRGAAPALRIVSLSLRDSSPPTDASQPENSLHAAGPSGHAPNDTPAITPTLPPCLGLAGDAVTQSAGDRPGNAADFLSSEAFISGSALTAYAAHELRGAGGRASIAFPEPTFSPLPPYPERARLERRGGTVQLQVHLSPHGRPTRVQVAVSSGYADLDAAAREVVQQRWRFPRAAVASSRPPLRVTVHFSLQDRHALVVLAAR
ncbi:energy transducer TonB [Opitutus sp. ER46]|uniref:energy transducer TonB n=1 Tax=Opitutus sp. ER46 TaxID=2161864 RepID=UPI00130481F1|nr:energy transducer TonB [Opitutus sp. ER46]